MKTNGHKVIPSPEAPPTSEVGMLTALATFNAAMRALSLTQNAAERIGSSEALTAFHDATVMLDEAMDALDRAVRAATEATRKEIWRRRAVVTLVPMGEG